ncbi:MAG TPA: hypothetical protein VGU20_01280 [Stellaceae bacterium]|nr:hypothetical protein [Stellaceae bacterium]
MDRPFAVTGDPRAIHEQGDAIYCGKPVAREGEASCAEHCAIVFTTFEDLTRQREAA